MLTILHLETSKLVQTWLKGIVESSGNKYIGANSIVKAFSLLEKTSVDMIITAIELDAFNGEIFIKRLNHSVYSNIPVLILTSADSLELRERIYNLGVVDYLVKGCIDDKLMKMYFKMFNEMKNNVMPFKIAVLDDSELTLSLINRILTLAQITDVDYYSRPERLIDAKVKYDIYIIDLILPGVSGEALLFKIKQKSPESVVVIMSTVSNYKTMSTILLTGADDYIMKPFDANLFIARLKVQMRYLETVRTLAQKNEALKRMALTDVLTGLYNRRYVIRQLKTEMARAKRYKKKLMLMLIDIDDFKSINDRFGHTMGDLVLKDVAHALSQMVRASDTVARYGGEEFLLIFPECRETAVVAIGEKILSGIQAIEFDVKDLRITVSGGACIVDAESVDEAIKIADKRLYLAKSKGKNRIEYQE